MKEEIAKVMRLVAEGKITPEEAAGLIEALNRTATPPPPPPSPPRASRDPVKGVFDFLDRLAKEGPDSVDWKEVSRRTQDTARKGVEVLRKGIDEVAQGKVNLDWLRQTEGKSLDVELPALEGKLLRVHNLAGPVKVVAGEGPARVKGEARFRDAGAEGARDRAESFELPVESTERAVSIIAPHLPGLELALEIHVPATVDLDLRVEAGDVDVRGTRGALKLHARSGRVRLEDVEGRVEVTSDSGAVLVRDARVTPLTLEHKSGDVRLEAIEGDITARMASGDLSVHSCSGGALQLETVSGDVTLTSEGPVDGSVTIRTVKGSATVHLPIGSDLKVSLGSLRGQVSVSGSLTEESRTSSRFTGRVGIGKGTLDVSAVTGDVMLEVE